MNPIQASSRTSRPPASPAIPASTTYSTRNGARSGLRWDSVWLQLAFSLMVGFLYALLVMGSGPLNPHNIDWLGEDGSQHYIGWELLRQDQWHWPLMYTNRWGYPVGDSVALVDVNPWMALPFKVFSPLLPEPFQYFGHRGCLNLRPSILLRIKAISPSPRCEPLGDSDGGTIFSDSSAPYLSPQVSLLFSQPLAVARCAAGIRPGTAGIARHGSALCSFSAPVGRVWGCHQPIHCFSDLVGDGGGGRQLTLEAPLNTATRLPDSWLLWVRSA